ncbi:MAG: hypothetical protein IJU37_08665, partial [Desulfovibrio sp.]|nr:hypothetical protein [Desulfovibrio sp.]
SRSSSDETTCHGGVRPSPNVMISLAFISSYIENVNPITFNFIIIMVSQLLFITSHFINNFVINEYNKLKWFDRHSLLVLDNDILHTHFARISKQKLFDTDIDIFLFDSQLHSNLSLPIIHGFHNLQWYNCDYRYYYVRHFFPNYDFYWQFESDVYSTYSDYKYYFNKYSNDTSDLLICNLRPESRDSKWNWNKKIDWIYDKNIHTYGSIFSVSRMSSRAIDFLYKKRLEHAKIFEESTLPDKRWLNCEVFAPTELINNNFTCKKINEPHVHFRPIWDIKECTEPNRLYHPVKSNL